MVEDGITFPQEDYLDADCRRQHIGEKLITDCLAQTKRCEFKVMQFNARWKATPTPATSTSTWVLCS